MELLGERPIWSMSGSEMLTTLDHLEADLARRQTYRLQLIAALDTTGHAADLGAHDTAQLLAFRYRLDRSTAYRDVRLARALPKYPTVTTALTDPVDTRVPAADPDPAGKAEGDSTVPITESGTDPDRADADHTGADHADADRADADHADADHADADHADADHTGAGVGEGERDGDRRGEGAAAWLLRPAQAEAIVSALERVPTTVPVEDLEVAEQQLVNLARHLTPSELRKAGKQIRDLLDTDGPEPDEHKAYARESLALITAENGVKFRGYLANENAELLRALIHTGARPHKTLDGELDPRPREKRQADALTTALTLAATATDTNRTTTDTNRTTTPPPTRPTPTTTDTPNTPLATTNLADNPDAPTAEPGTAAATTGNPNTPLAADDPDATAAEPSTAAPTTGNPNTTLAADNPDATLAANNPDATTAEAGTAAPTTGRPEGTAGAEGATAAGASAADAGVVAGGRSPAWVPGFGAKANITVTIDLEDLKSAAADATGGLVYGDNLSAAAIRRLACDANIIPLVLGSNSEPLDVGRSERLVTRAMRRALNARDKGCVVCGAPPVQCDAHHLRSWIDGGPTAIWNLVLLCRRHHIDLHAGHWTITITNGKVHVYRPTWADPPPPTPKHHSTAPPNPRTDSSRRRPPAARPPDERAPDERLLDERPPDERALDGRLLDERPPEERAPEERAPDERPYDERPPEDLALDERPPEERAPDERPSDERPPDELRAGWPQPEELRSDRSELDGPWSGDPWPDRVRSDGLWAEGLRPDDAARMDSGRSQGRRTAAPTGVTACAVNRPADAAARREAARQAIWGDTSTSSSGVPTGPRGTSRPSAEPAHHDPWAEPTRPTAVRPPRK
ncbi:DUF222 domain-containing protein [Kribbella capetownensis]|uniref:DUF222 domain-containing protein n=1 Tax=Kribbella capetownensis TaxID=1572659 RepID=A0A4R0JAN1_9ACTN|nr:HNH endonuclease signature motif containing protein [Kribbella capetownensis]TCC42850.1 DUF222 domain-containing protein [Kribbella capetownensis]